MKKLLLLAGLACIGFLGCKSSAPKSAQSPQPVINGDGSGIGGAAYGGGAYGGAAYGKR